MTLADSVKLWDGRIDRLKDSRNVLCCVTPFWEMLSSLSTCHPFALHWNSHFNKMSPPHQSFSFLKCFSYLYACSLIPLSTAWFVFWVASSNRENIHKDDWGETDSYYRCSLCAADVFLPTISFALLGYSWVSIFFPKMHLRFHSYIIKI